MGSTFTVTLGIAFVITAVMATFLMYYLWRFDFDKQQLRSHAPKHLILIHKLLGYFYIATYIYLLYHMTPRLWTYQIELPPRTVAHLVFGILIGAILVAKIAVVRYFKHLEAKLAPILGTLLFVCSITLIFLAIPFALKEIQLKAEVLSEAPFNTTRLERVNSNLPILGLRDDALLAHLSTPEGLLDGRNIMIKKCTQCHDMRTILAMPRTPDDWHSIVVRMANRSTVLDAITSDETWHILAYLIAISPTLQKSLQQQRTQTLEHDKTQTVLSKAKEKLKVAPANPINHYDASVAKRVFQAKCSQCHSYTQIDRKPPANMKELVMLISRMIDNGLTLSDAELDMILRYLKENKIRS